MARNRLIIALCSSLVLLSNAGSAASVAKVYEYARNMASRSGNIIITVDGFKWKTGDFRISVGDDYEVWDAVTCKHKTQNPDFVCFLSERYSFAVPRNLSASTREWRYDNHLFRITHAKPYTIWMLGLNIKNVYRIDAYKISDPERVVSTTTYTPTQGILGIYLPNGGEEATPINAWLTKSRGFGKILAAPAPEK